MQALNTSLMEPLFAPLALQHAVVPLAGASTVTVCLLPVALVTLIPG